MSHLTIELDGAELGATGPITTADADGWWSDGTLITIRNTRRIASYRLPKGRAKVVLERYGDGTGQLIIGGFTSTAVTVRGRMDVLEELRKRVL